MSGHVGSIVRFAQVTKRYSRMTRPLGSLLRWKTPRLAPVTALEEVSFSLRQGEAVGLIGANGSGKSTTLKLLAGITRPTSGSVEVEGRVASLIEVGAGFHPELTGRDNVLLNGAILGMSRAEISGKYDSIVDFAELSDFMDMSVKHYSSGMFMRLGLAVAVHTDPDILLVDEVLAVGDARFQARSMERMRELMERGVTVLFVSHSLNLIQGLCSRALYLRSGRLIAEGATDVVIHNYLDDIDLENARAHPPSEHKGALVDVTAVRFRGPRGQEVEAARTGEDLAIDIYYRARARIDTGYFTVAVSDDRGCLLMQASMLVDVAKPDGLYDDGVMTVTFHALPLLPRTYHLWCEVLGGFGVAELFPWSIVSPLRVAGVDPAAVPLHAGSSVWHVRGDAPVYVSHTWQHTAVQHDGRPNARGHDRAHGT